MALFKNIKSLRAQAEDSISALPGLVMQAEKIAATIMHGEHSQRKSGSGEMFRQFRPYEQSDRPQDIDWRQSAKADQVFVKQRELQSTVKTYLWCANAPSMRFSSDPAFLQKQHAAHVLTMALALLTRSAKEPVGLINDMKTGRSDAHMIAMAELLNAPVKGGAEKVLPEMDNSILPFPKHSAFYGVGDFLSPIDEIKHCLSKIAAKTENVIIVQVLDPAEITLNYTGRMRFRNGGDHDHIINHVPSIRTAYQNRVHAHIEALQRLCLGYNWGVYLHTTDTPLHDSLRDIWGIASEKGL